ncbi:MAG TPA: aminotransferase class IV [Acidimicrobiia bacterium]|nr:aminotransferase class IV [Acidimicrobiia bacterium]
MSDPVLWLDGELLSAADARVSPFDHGLLVGDGVFETLRVYDGVPFAWARHHRRLVRSAAGLGLAAPGSEELRVAVDEVLAANGLSEGRVRVTVTGGPSPLGSERGDGPPTVIVVAAPAAAWPATVDVVIVPWSRNENGAVAGLKTTSYAENVRALAYARERDAGEAVFLNTRGEVCEATGSNLFAIRDGVVRTPPADAGCLLGVTRALVLELCAENGMPAEEAVLGAAALREADEAFLTSSTREVQPIGRVDGRALPSAPGATSEKLAGLLTDLIARNPDP